jgi:2-dehydro-3-deoxyglucarate aldolase
MEHAPTGLARVQEMIQATGGRVPCLVRAPWNDGVWIKRILDTGCDGIVIPQIRSAAEAREAIRNCKYPPIGTRSVGIARAQGYGMTLQDYIENADERLITVLQTEHIDAAKVRSVTPMYSKPSERLRPHVWTDKFLLASSLSMLRRQRCR